MKRGHLSFAFLMLFVFIGSTSLLQGASIVIVNKDAAGVGFNDPTPAAPVGGNSGTTLGQQRLNVFQAAAAIWGSKLSSPVTIRIAANFGPLTPCSTGSGVLGSAGPRSSFANFTNAPRINTWYPVALASALSGTDLAATLADGAAIGASFNSNIGTATCLPTLSWYLGTDANHGSQIDLETVLLHEFGHGLGFTGLVRTTDGGFGGAGFTRPDIFSTLTFDNTAFLHWDVMSAAQRVTSMTNVGNVVLDGSNVTAGASILTAAGKDGSGHAKLFTPSPVQSGSSIYHFDTSASPNQLMEPSISSDLTHNVDLPNDLTMKLMIDIGWPVAVAAPAAPSGVTATASSATSVTVSWSAVVGATSYEVWREAAGGIFTKINVATVTAPPFSDTVASTPAAYLYRVIAVNSGGSSPPSVSDLATNMIYTDAALTPGATTIKAAHVTELRTVVNAVRALAGLPAGIWTSSVTTGSTIAASSVLDLRTNLDAAITQIKSTIALSISAGLYTDTSPVGIPVKAVHISEIRSRMF